MNEREMVEQFQCPGCACGHDSECGVYKFNHVWLRCTGHVLGSLISGIGNFAPGLPKGFCRPGYSDDTKPLTKSQINIRLWVRGTQPDWNRCNVPVWAMVQDGFLFVRTYMPRINNGTVDVIEGGTLDMVPGAIDVGEFYDEID